MTWSHFVDFQGRLQRILACFKGFVLIYTQWEVQKTLFCDNSTEFNSQAMESCAEPGAGQLACCLSPYLDVRSRAGCESPSLLSAFSVQLGFSGPENETLARSAAGLFESSPNC